MGVNPQCNVRVSCRFRPANALEEEHGSHGCVEIGEDRTSVLFLGADASNKADVDDESNTFSFDSVFQESSSQEQVYAFCAAPLVDEVLEGFSCTLFMYGQTGSGKTHTMMGGIDGPREHRGILPRIAEDIFCAMGNASANTEFVVKVSYVEIYMERIRDLLNPGPSGQNLKIREDRIGGVSLDGAQETYVASAEELLRVVSKGSASLAIASTRMNQDSSRSHSVFALTISQRNTAKDVTKTGRLYLVDLAGSEMVKKTRATANVLEEAKMINRSLSALGNVIKGLADGARHIPYRDSKLTRMLQDSLGGNSKTSLIITCSAASYNAAETLSTLRFGKRAKLIKNKPKVNRSYSVAEYKHMLASARLAIQEIGQYCRALEKRTGILPEESILKEKSGKSHFYISNSPSSAREVQQGGTATTHTVLPSHDSSLPPPPHINNTIGKSSDQITNTVTSSAEGEATQTNENPPSQSSSSAPNQTICNQVQQQAQLDGSKSKSETKTETKTESKPESEPEPKLKSEPEANVKVEPEPKLEQQQQCTLNGHKHTGGTLTVSTAPHQSETGQGNQRIEATGEPSSGSAASTDDEGSSIFTSEMYSSMGVLSPNSIEVLRNRAEEAEAELEVTKSAVDGLREQIRETQDKLGRQAAEKASLAEKAAALQLDYERALFQEKELKLSVEGLQSENALLREQIVQAESTKSGEKETLEQDLKDLMDKYIQTKLAHEDVKASVSASGNGDINVLLKALASERENTSTLRQQNIALKSMAQIAQKAQESWKLKLSNREEQIEFLEAALRGFQETFKTCNETMAELQAELTLYRSAMDALEATSKESKTGANEGAHEMQEGTLSDGTRLRSRRSSAPVLPVAGAGAAAVPQFIKPLRGGQLVHITQTLDTSLDSESGYVTPNEEPTPPASLGYLSPVATQSPAPTKRGSATSWFLNKLSALSPMASSASSAPAQKWKRPQRRASIDANLLDDDVCDTDTDHEQGLDHDLEDESQNTIAQGKSMHHAKSEHTADAAHVEAKQGSSP